MLIRGEQIQVEGIKFHQQVNIIIITDIRPISIEIWTMMVIWIVRIILLIRPSSRPRVKKPPGASIIMIAGS